MVVASCSMHLKVHNAQQHTSHIIQGLMWGDAFLIQFLQSWVCAGPSCWPVMDGLHFLPECYLNGKNLAMISAYEVVTLFSCSILAKLTLPCTHTIVCLPKYWTVLWRATSDRVAVVLMPLGVFCGYSEQASHTH